MTHGIHSNITQERLEKWVSQGRAGKWVANHNKGYDLYRVPLNDSFNQPFQYLDFMVWRKSGKVTIVNFMG